MSSITSFFPHIIIHLSQRIYVHTLLYFLLVHNITFIKYFIYIYTLQKYNNSPYFTLCVSTRSSKLYFIHATIYIKYLIFLFQDCQRLFFRCLINCCFTIPVQILVFHQLFTLFLSSVLFKHTLLYVFFFYYYLVLQ